MDQYLSDARIFKAFCDENRLQILELLRTGEKCACACWSSCTSASPPSPTICVFCATLGSCPGRTEGKRTHYRICRKAAKRLRGVCWLSTQQSPPALSGGCQCVEVKATPKRWVFLLLYISKILEGFL